MYIGFIVLYISYLYKLMLLYRPNQGPSKSMIHVLIITCRRVLKTFYILCLVFSSFFHNGVGWWDGTSSHKYLMWPSRLALHPGIVFTRWIIQNLQYLFFWLLNHVHSGQIEGQWALCAHTFLVFLFVHTLIIYIHQFLALVSCVYFVDRL